MKKSEFEKFQAIFEKMVKYDDYKKYCQEEDYFYIDSILNAVDAARRKSQCSGKYISSGQIEAVEYSKRNIIIFAVSTSATRLNNHVYVKLLPGDYKFISCENAHKIRNNQNEEEYNKSLRFFCMMGPDKYPPIKDFIW